MAQCSISEEVLFSKVLAREQAMSTQHSGTMLASEMWTVGLSQVKMTSHGL